MLPWLLVGLVAATTGAPALAQAPFVRGDYNADGEVDVSDAVGTLFVLFAGKPSPGCERPGAAHSDSRNPLT